MDETVYGTQTLTVPTASTILAIPLKFTIIALSNVVSTWLAALIVTVVVGLLAGILLLVGIKLLRRGVPPAPTESVDQMKEDVSWVKARARSGAT